MGSDFRRNHVDDEKDLSLDFNSEQILYVSDSGRFQPQEANHFKKS